MNIFTDEDIKEIVGPWGDTPIKGYTRSLFDKIEAKLREKQEVNTLRDAAQQALEALEQLQGGCTDSNDGTVEAITVWCPEVIKALRAALAEPQPQPQPQPLTDEQIEACYETAGHYQSLRPQDRFVVFALARAIERAHGIGGDK